MLVFIILTTATLSTVCFYYSEAYTPTKDTVQTGDYLLTSWLEALDQTEPTAVIVGSVTTTGTTLFSPVQALLGIVLYGLVIVAGTFYLACCFRVLEDNYNQEWSEKETEARITAIGKRLDIEYGEFALNFNPTAARNFFTKWPQNYRYSHKEFLQIKNHDMFFTDSIVNLPVYWIEPTFHFTWHIVIWAILILIWLCLALIFWFFYGPIFWWPVRIKRPRRR